MLTSHVRRLILNRTKDEPETAMKKRLIALVDGENLVFRYQEMLRHGRVPYEDNVHVTDAFVWNPRLLGAPITFDVIRVTYYTSVTGGTERAPAVKDAIQAQMYSCGDERTRSWHRLNAAVFSKSAQSKKTKLVDMRICIDALANTMNANMDVLYLVSGDGDFVPLVEEVMRHGVRVRVLALGDCVADSMKSAGDEFAYLDDMLFKHAT